VESCNLHEVAFEFFSQVTYRRFRFFGGHFLRLHVCSEIDRELSEDIAYYFNYPSTEQEEEKERSSWCLSTLMYRFVGHVVTVDPCTRGKVPNTTLPLNEARSLELQSNRASEASLGGSNDIE